MTLGISRDSSRTHGFAATRTHDWQVDDDCLSWVVGGATMLLYHLPDCGVGVLRQLSRRCVGSIRPAQDASLGEGGRDGRGITVTAPYNLRYRADELSW